MTTWTSVIKGHPPRPGIPAARAGGAGGSGFTDNTQAMATVNEAASLAATTEECCISIARVGLESR